MAFFDLGLTSLLSLGSAFMAQQGQEETNRMNQANAREQMDFQERMSSTAHQREVKDLIAAGLNPMLSARYGGASTPGGAMSVAQNPAEKGSSAFAQTMGAQAAQQGIELTKAQTAKTQAETEVAQASATEIRERTGTYAPTIEATLQGVAESKQRVENMIADIHRIGATTANLAQQTTNLQEIIPQIRATIDNLRAQTTLHGAHTKLAAGHTAQAYAQTGLAQAETAEVRQRTAENLPALEAALKKLERVAEEMKMPGRQQDEAVQDSFLGSLSAVVKALNPFAAVVPSIGVRGTGQPSPQRDTRKDWKK